jgi:hypothetical protein
MRQGPATVAEQGPVEHRLNPPSSPNQLQVPRKALPLIFKCAQHVRHHAVPYPTQHLLPAAATCVPALPCGGCLRQLAQQQPSLTALWRRDQVPTVPRRLGWALHRRRRPPMRAPMQVMAESLSGIGPVSCCSAGGEASSACCLHHIAVGAAHHIRPCGCR